MEINFAKVEKKWQDKWAKDKTFEVKENPKKKKYYVLEMFPYPSGSGLHMGHAWNYSIGDIMARFKKMKGLNVLHPMGYDALGLPAENAAIKEGVHPEEYTKKSIKKFTEQFKELGISYDWSRTFSTADPEYYKWDQWIFLQMFRKKLAYQKESSVNWCPKCDTVLANEQVQNGKCWRHEDTSVELKSLKQWFLKITDYADELYEKIDSLDWPERTKAMQKNWIGKSEGINFKEKVRDLDIEFEVYDSIPQTFLAQTFTIIAPEHPLVEKLVKGTKYEKPVLDFVEKIKKKKLSGRFDIETDIEGIFTGRYVKNPFGLGDFPIWVASFVLADYGTGIVNCSAHDERDFEFAKKYKIPLRIAMLPKDKAEAERVSNFEYCYHHADDGLIQIPKEFKGQTWKESRDRIIDYIEKKAFGKKAINFKLRDWGISRQRYWGTPIPIIHCEKCGAVPVPEKDLPVKLPHDVKFGKGNPLETAANWVNTKCPKCKGKAKRETDTMDTFVNSSWYFLRYCDPKNKKAIFDKKKVNYWCPVDIYVGGAEHACMHLIYFRFYTKFLNDIGLTKFREPAKKLFHQGTLLGEDGVKMSKSRPNSCVLPETVSKKYGMDTARFFLSNLASPDKNIEWSDRGISGSAKFIKRIFSHFDSKPGKDTPQLIEKLNKTIGNLTGYYENFQYRKATIEIRELFSLMEKGSSKQTREKFLQILNPICPHITEELWEKLGNKKMISTSQWPKAEKIKSSKRESGINETAISDIKYILEKTKAKPKKVYLYAMPFEIKNLDKNKISKQAGLPTEIFAVNDKNKYDPKNKAKKAKPGKPSIFFE